MGKFLKFYFLIKIIIVITSYIISLLNSFKQLKNVNILIIILNLYTFSTKFHNSETFYYDERDFNVFHEKLIRLNSFHLFNIHNNTTHMI